MPQSSLSIEQVLAVLRAARARRERDWLMFALAFNHGLRASEVVNLKADNVRDGYLTVQRLKGSLKTIQPLIEHQNSLLDEKGPALELARHSSLLFPICRQHFWTLFRRYARQAGLPAHLQHPHVLKHSLAMKLIGTAGFENTRQYLGHKNAGSTGAYLKVDDEAASAAAGRALSALE